MKKWAWRPWVCCIQHRVVSKLLPVFRVAVYLSNPYSYCISHFMTFTASVYMVCYFRVSG